MLLNCNFRRFVQNPGYSCLQILAMDSVRVATGQSHKGTQSEIQPILTSYLNAASVFFVTSLAKLHSLAS